MCVSLSPLVSISVSLLLGDREGKKAAVSHLRDAVTRLGYWIKPHLQPLSSPWFHCWSPWNPVPASHTLPAKGALLISGNWNHFLGLAPPLQMRALRLQGVEN